MKKKKQKTIYIDFGTVDASLYNYSIFESPADNYVTVNFSIYKITEDNKYEMTAEFSLTENEVINMLKKINKLKGVK